MTYDMMTPADSEAVRDTTTAVRGQVIMPFYLIIDVSSSMRGEETNLNGAVKELIEEIRLDPIVDDLVMLSIITFNHDAQTVRPLDNPSGLVPPTFTVSGGTNYGAAFTEYHRAFEQDRARLTNEGIKVYRPCVFFLTDGDPGDKDYLQTFQRLFAFDPESKIGNRAFPYFVSYGFGGATVPVIQSLAYPDWGGPKGRWFMSSSDDVRYILREMAKMLGKTVISGGLSASQGNPQTVPPTPEPGSDVQWGEAGGGFVN